MPNKLDIIRRGDREVQVYDPTPAEREESRRNFERHREAVMASLDVNSTPTPNSSLTEDQ